MGFFSRLKELKNYEKTISEKKSLLDVFEKDKNNLLTEIENLKEEIENIKNDKTVISNNIIKEATKDAQIINAEILKAIEENKQENLLISENINKANNELNSINKKIHKEKSKIYNMQIYYKGIEYSVYQYRISEKRSIDVAPPILMSEIKNELNPDVILKLHCMDFKELKKEFEANNKQIEHILNVYETRYTTKANISIYNLMVIALKSELQNVLYNLKYDKLEKSIDYIKSITKKYYNITAEGNQTIAPTVLKFIGEIEYFFIRAVKIEHEYYAKKEQAKEEQLALREQMKQEEAERKELERQKKLIEKEEEKYINEIENLKKSFADNANEELKNRIIELENLLIDLEDKKEDIIKLQNGKAGYVYVISNIGSFGEDVFKIGMTRRIDPQDRINELGNASVPFRFDVHSFIFSEDAVEMENKLHSILNNKRVNKINTRKEFFKTNLNELENIVLQIEPTAEFNKTMLAEQYRLSLEIDDKELVYQ